MSSTTVRRGGRPTWPRAAAAPPEAQRNPRLIVIDGITVTFADLQPYYLATEFRPGLESALSMRGPA